MEWPELQADFARYLQGDEAAARRLFTALLARLVPFFNARTRERALSEDLAQATLLKIHFARERFDPKLSLKTWVFTIAGRCLIDHWRGRGRGRGGDTLTDHDEEALTAVPDPELSPALKAELKGDLTQALDILKPNDRMIVYLYAVEEFSMAEIAQSMGLSESAVKVRAHRAYVQLREKLK